MNMKVYLERRVLALYESLRDLRFSVVGVDGCPKRYEGQRSSDLRILDIFILGYKRKDKDEQFLREVGDWGWVGPVVCEICSAVD